MSKHEKLLAKFCRSPRPKDFSWDELVSLLDYLGFDIDQSGGGSHCFFGFRSNPDWMIHTYRPHPNGILYQQQIKEITKQLEQWGLLNGD